MQIVKPEFGGSAAGRGRRRRTAIIVLVGLAYSGLLIVTGAAMHRNAFFSDSVMPFLRASADWPLKWTESLSVEPEQLTLDMNWESYQRLAYHRERALEVGSLFVDSDDYVPGTLTTDSGEHARVKMRLKGDGVDHLRGDKWSFRVRTRGDSTIRGLKQFSLHHPRVRNWLFEWLAHRAMAREGVIALRYDFVAVTLNGKSLGIYACEEHFEKRLVEHNTRREGPIVRFGEDLMWREIVAQHRPFDGSEANGAGSFAASGVDGFQTGKMLKDPTGRSQYLRAVHLLELFRRGELPTRDVFDVTILARYFALIDLFGGEHGARWNNIRLYYNPVTGLLEPIAFDLLGGKPTRAISLSGGGDTISQGRLVSRSDPFGQLMFDDPVFCATYLRELTRISDAAYLDDLLSETEPDRKTALATLYSEFPYYEFSTDVLYRNQRYLRSVLDVEVGVMGYADAMTNEQLPLQIGNLQPLPLEILGVVIDGNTYVDTPAPIALARRQRDEPLRFQRILIDLPADLKRDDTRAPSVSVRYRVLGTDRILTTACASYALTLEAQLAQVRALHTSTVEQFEFVSVDEDTKTIRIRPGRWALRSDLIIPGGYVVDCGPDTRLDLLEGAMILSRSPLQLRGTSEQPIVVHSTDQTGQGFVVLDADGESRVEHVLFDGLSNPVRGGWSLTGAVTFYESPVSFENVQFLRAGCEDALNLVRSRFSIIECSFTDVFSDALDADFCQGVVLRSVFSKPGNDAVDVSGSAVHLTDVTVTDAGDKAVSAGEVSEVTIEGLRIDGSRIGVACKDTSDVLINGASIKDSQIGLLSFQKKPEFGPGQLRAFGVTFENVDQMYLNETGSTLTVDGVAQASNTENVRGLLYE